jgi:hypothetical protein
MMPLGVVVINRVEVALKQMIVEGQELVISNLVVLMFFLINQCRQLLLMGLK